RQRCQNSHIEKCRSMQQPLTVLDLTSFQNLALRGGFLIAEVRLTAQPLLDPLERAATAQTIIRGTRFHIFLRADLDERELSISLYHEVLEAAAVASTRPPDAVLELNEGTRPFGSRVSWNPQSTAGGVWVLRLVCPHETDIELLSLKLA